MRKIVTLVLMGLLLLSFTACSNNWTGEESAEDFLAHVYKDTITEAMDSTDQSNLEEQITQDVRDSLADKFDSDTFDITQTQAIEIHAIDGDLLRDITEKVEIINFTWNKHVEDWQYFVSLPNTATPLYRLVHIGKNQQESFVETLYEAPDGEYFVEMDSAILNNSIVASISTDAAGFIISTAEGGDIPSYNP